MLRGGSPKLLSPSPLENILWLLNCSVPSQLDAVIACQGHTLADLCRWALLQFLMPGAFGPAADFDRWFAAPLQALRLAAAEGGGGGTEETGAPMQEEEFMLATSRLHQVGRALEMLQLPL